MIWQRIGENGKYCPGKDSPENHYINDDVCWCFSQYAATKQPEDEQYEESAKKIFVTGQPAANKLWWVPQTIVGSTLLARASITSFYLLDWKREPYEEELTTIYEMIMRAI